MEYDDSGVKEEEGIVIAERRKSKRLKEDNETAITIISPKKESHKKIIYTLIKDISVSGAGIQVNSFLPVDTLLEIKVTLKDPPQMITALGKVKWIKIIIDDEHYEAGIEFVNTPGETIRQLAEYISRKL